MDEETGEWVSKNELKKRQTARKKEAEAAEKKAKKKDAPQAKGKKTGDTQEEDEKDPSKYTEIRKKMLLDLRK